MVGHDVMQCDVDENGVVDEADDSRGGKIVSENMTRQSSTLR